MRDEFSSRLKGKVVVLGIGNTLRSDDGAGPKLINLIRDRTDFLVFDVGQTPENYLGKVVKEKPDTVVVVDAVDFGGLAGEFKFLEANDLKTVNLFFTHNASISLAINYLQSNLKADIIILIIQPKSVALGDKLSPQVSLTVEKLQRFFVKGTENARS